MLILVDVFKAQAVYILNSLNPKILLYYLLPVQPFPLKKLIFTIL